MLIDLSNSARKFLMKLDAKQSKQVTMKLLDLSVNARPNDCKALKNSPEGYLRVDIGEFRIVYRIDGDIVRVDYVGKRNDDAIFKKLK